MAKINSIDDVKTERNGNFLNNKVNIFLKLIYKNRSNDSYSDLSHFINASLIENNSGSDDADSDDEVNKGDEEVNKGDDEENKTDDEANKSDDESIEECRIIGLENEFKFLNDCLSRLNCTEIVFSHNDLSQENIYQRLDSTSRLYVLNYDLSGYNYRGYDLGKYEFNVDFQYEIHL